MAGIVSSDATRLALSDIARKLCSECGLDSKEDIFKAVQSLLWSDSIRQACFDEFVSLILGHYDNQGLGASVQYLNDEVPEDHVAKLPQSAALIQKIANDYVLDM